MRAYAPAHASAGSAPAAVDRGSHGTGRTDRVPATDVVAARRSRSHRADSPVLSRHVHVARRHADRSLAAGARDDAAAGAQAASVSRVHTDRPATDADVRRGARADRRARRSMIAEYDI